jgi:protein tyrosine/serine phosphatase
MINHVRVRPVILAAVWLLAGSALAAEPAGGPAAPATNGLPNFHKVTDALYRGAQPLDSGYAQLKALGIRTVVSLRAFHSEADAVAKAGLNYESIPMNTWHAEMEDLVRFLQVVGDTNKTPVFVHCQHGADRTGLMCATYRIFDCGWDKTAAIKEMTDGGFGFHPVWQNIVEFIQNLDTNAVRRELDAPVKPTEGKR